jgi:hypothetical protein
MDTETAVLANAGVACMKAILNARGIDCGDVRPPFKYVPADTPVVPETAEMIEN